jgi:hypothetical protein
MRQDTCQPLNETCNRVRVCVMIACTLLLMLAVRASASELPAAAPDTSIPDWVIAGIAAVETGSTYRGGRLVRYRDHRDGAAGEVGPWQIAPAVLDDLGAAHLRARVRTEPVLAESLVRAWLLRCYHRTGSWKSAVAVYHAGPGGSTRRGSSYASRVYNAGFATLQ